MYGYEIADAVSELCGEGRRIKADINSYNDGYYDIFAVGDNAIVLSSEMGAGLNNAYSVDDLHGIASSDGMNEMLLVMPPDYGYESAICDIDDAYIDYGDSGDYPVLILVCGAERDDKYYDDYTCSVASRM